VNYPLPRTAAEELDKQTTSGLGFSVALMVIFGMSFLVAYFIIFPGGTPLRCMLIGSPVPFHRAVPSLFAQSPLSCFMAALRRDLLCDA
jgi:hypothetical protein